MVNEEWVQPQGVVLDTNLWGRGDVDILAIENMARRLAPYGVEVWVPLQVVCEWSEHALAQLQKWKSANKKLIKAGFAVGNISGESEMPGSWEGLRSRLEGLENVQVLKMDGDNAREAIIDQILGRGAAGIKGDVKTGAVDSSIVRDGLSQGAGADEVIFVTRNVKDFRKAAELLGSDIRTCDVAGVYRRGNAIPPYSADGTLTFEDFVGSESLRGLLSTYWSEFRRNELDADAHGGVRGSMFPWSLGSPDGTMSRVSLDWHVSDMEVQAEPVLSSVLVEEVTDFSISGESLEDYSLMALVDCQFTAALSVDGYILNRDGEVEMQSEWWDGVILEGVFQVTVERGKVVEFELLGDVSVDVMVAP